MARECLQRMWLPSDLSRFDWRARKHTLPLPFARGYEAHLLGLSVLRSGRFLYLSYAGTTTIRTSISSSTASPKPLRSSALNPTRPLRRLMGTAPGCRGGGERTGGIRLSGPRVRGRSCPSRTSLARPPRVYRGGLGCVRASSYWACRVKSSRSAASRCAVWRSVLNDARRGRLAGGHESPVLMRRLALGALWRAWTARASCTGLPSLNAPFGARCFMAPRGPVPVSFQRQGS